MLLYTEAELVAKSAIPMYPTKHVRGRLVLTLIDDSRGSQLFLSAGLFTFSVLDGPIAATLTERRKCSTTDAPDFQLRMYGSSTAAGASFPSLLVRRKLVAVSGSWEAELH